MKIHFFSARRVKAIYYKMGGFLAVQCCIETSEPCGIEIGDETDPPVVQDPFCTTPLFTARSTPVSTPISVDRLINEATTLPVKRTTF